MQITVKLFATLRIERFKVKDFDYPIGTTVERIINDLSIPRKELGIIFLNGKAASLSTVLTDQDILSIFPPVGGG